MHRLSRKTFAALVFALMLGGCTSTGSELTQRANTPSTSHAAGSTTSTSSAATTTTPTGPGYVIARSTALVVTDCLNLWYEVRSTAPIVGFKRADLVAASARCSSAARALDIDLVGAPLGPLPARQLALMIASLNTAMLGAQNRFTAATCRDLCTLEPADEDTFLVFREGTPSIPPAFVGPTVGLTRPGLDKVKDLSIR